MSGVKNIVIVGAGTTGYLAAFHLCETYPNKKITWIYPEENKPIGVGEAIIPEVSNFLQNFGVKHQDILKYCNGTLKFGIYFKGWNRPGENFTFTFGQGAPNRFNSSSQDRIVKTNKIPKNIFDYSQHISTHFRVTELLEFLEKFGKKFKNLSIIRKKVTLNDVKDNYDLIIDCTGFDRTISYMPNNFKTISDKIPNDQVFLFRNEYTDREKQCVPYTVSEAMESGWCFNIPLRNELACGYVHHGKYDVMNEYLQYLENKFNKKIDSSSIRILKMVTGRNKIHLKNNIVSIGLSSTFIEPLESTGLYLVTHSLNRLCDYLDGKISEVEYNFFVNEEFDAITDFIVDHYKFSKRDNEYWNFYKSVQTKKRPVNIFPDSSWDTIKSGFLEEVKRPIEPLDGKELIEIHRGKPFHEWLLNEENYK